MDPTNVPAIELEALVAEIVSSYVRKNYVAPADISAVITTVYQSLAGLGKPVEPERTPAVPLSRSSGRDYVFCLDCGWRGKMLKRHLPVRHGLQESEYRTRWGLAPTYRLTATAYSETRAALAKEHGLGLTRQGVVQAEAPREVSPLLS